MFFSLLATEAEKKAPNIQEKLSTLLANYWWVLLIIAGLVLIGYGIYEAVRKGFSLKKLVEIIKSRKFVRGMSTTAAVLSIAVILISLNIVLYKIKVPSFDLTKEKIFTLSDQTKKILKNLQAEIKIVGFFKTGSSDEARFRDLIELFKRETNKLRVEIYDPDKHPSLARQYDVPRYGIVYVEGPKKRETVWEINEKALIRGILEASTEEKLKIYFLTGHGEKEPDNYTDFGYSRLKNALEQENYEVEKLLLFGRKEGVPKDCAVLVIAGAVKPLSAEEMQAIKKYVENGGKLLLMLEPYPAPSFKDLLEPHGVEPLKAIAVDPAQCLSGEVLAPVVSRYMHHEITRKMGLTFYPTLRPLKIKEPKKARALAKTSKFSWAETSLTKISFNELTDVKGPLTVAAVVDYDPDDIAPEEGKDRPRIKMVVFGDSDFSMNAYVYIPPTMNGNFVLNAIDWLAERPELVGIRPKEPTPAYVALTKAKARMVQILSLIAVPGAVFVAGWIVWLGRRRKK